LPSAKAEAGPVRLVDGWSTGKRVLLGLFAASMVMQLVLGVAIVWWMLR
jgi:hypothetical protein